MGFAGAALGAMALVVSLTGRSDAPLPTPVEPDRPTAPRIPEPDEDRLADLEDRLARLARRVTLLENQPTRTLGPGSGSDVQQEIEALRSDVDAVLSVAPLETEEGRRRLEEIVKNVQSEAMAERMEAWRKRREQAEDDRLTRFIQSSNLDSGQELELRRLVTEERGKVRAAFESMRSGDVHFQDVRRTIRSVRAETDAQVERILDEPQLADYQEMRAEDRFGRRRRRRANDTDER